MSDPSRPSQQAEHGLSSNARLIILVVAFLAWFFGGMQILLTNLGMRPASLDLMGQVGTIDLAVFNELAPRADELVGDDKAKLVGWNQLAAQWYAWFQCAFLFGAALGGYIFGKLGDRIGRTRALGLSILVFAGLTGACYLAQSPGQLLVLRFLACLGIGGGWPNSVALVFEVWEGKGRPLAASMIGMAGNLGIFAMSSLAKIRPVVPDDWQWMIGVNTLPVFLGLYVLLFVRESPTWRRFREIGGAIIEVPDSVRSESAGSESDAEKPPSLLDAKYLPVTIVGIVLATVPLIGGWGSANWMMPWAGEVGEAMGDNTIQANVGMARSLTSIVGSLFAGLIAARLGRRLVYFLTSFGALLVAQYVFWFSSPSDSSFLLWVALLGLFNGLYFGWLPFFLPELFPTRIRATGAGVSFNFGRILTGGTLLATGYLMATFGGDYAKIGRVTSVVFLVGMIAILFAPDTSKRDMAD